MTIPITGHTGFTGLLGSPVSHSISPMMHNESFRMVGLDLIYLCFDVKEEQLDTAVAGLKAAGIHGFNLTMPCKNRMVSLCDELSPAASLIGAVNTVVNQDGKLIGHNTDGIGFWRSAEEVGFSSPGKNVTLMGMGGAATAIAVQAALDGVKELNIFARPTSRFWQRANNLTDELNKRTTCKVQLFEQQDTSTLKKCLDHSDILVNGTSVGMAPNTETSILPDSTLLHPELTVADVIYNPQETLLLKQAKAVGCPVFNGMYMLLYQGAEAFRLWTGVDMPVEHIKERYFK
ncbi:shikimate dehydrogenase [bacterium]|nr:shikimate dehydrogenase [bacterium]MDY3023596.1 shikimate dehydrogenase [Oliverpabstia sp.]